VADATDAAYLDYKQNYQGIFGRDFSAEPTTPTVVGNGLKPQYGIGLFWYPGNAAALAGIAAGVPGAFQMGEGLIHSTMGVDISMGGPLDFEDLRYLYARQMNALECVMHEVLGGLSADARAKLAFGGMRLLTSADALVAVGDPSLELFAARQRLLEAATAAGVPLNPQWGPNITLARYLRKLGVRQTETLGKLMAANQSIPAGPVAGAFCAVLAVKGRAVKDRKFHFVYARELMF
jgi:hypothetical protein